MRIKFNGQGTNTPEEIANWVSRYRASGLGLQRFAQEHGIAATRLHYWVYRRARLRPTRPDSDRPLFQEVKFAEGLPLPGNWAAEISLPEGRAIRFGAAAPPVWIGSVVQALRRPC
jgi:hypothetical protein